MQSQKQNENEEMKFLNQTMKPQEAGWKAFRLHELMKLGMPVPDGFVVKEEISLESLKEAMSRLGEGEVAARSSSLVEDLAGASFAGLYESYLELKTPAQVLEAIKKCFIAADSDRVKQYLKDKGHTEVKTQMRVLVQKMVPAQKAGVLFTLPPVSGKEEHFYIEVVAGLGESLVSGTTTPSQITWDYARELKVKEALNESRVSLSENELIELSELSLKIQAFYGSPQDIEWAVDQKGKVWILQSRPITHVNWRDDVDDHTNADLKDGGISARVCTPLMFSLYEAAMETSMPGYFKKIKLFKTTDGIKWLRMHYGRAYWNAGAVKKGLSQLPDFNEQHFDQDLGIQKDYGGIGPQKTSLSIQSLLAAIPVLMGLYQEFDDCLSANAKFKPYFEKQDAFLKERLKKMSELSKSELKELLIEIFIFQKQTEEHYFRTIYNNANFQTEFKSLLKKWDTEDKIDRLKLMSGLSDVSHLKIQTGLEKISKNGQEFGWNHINVKKALEEFLSVNYHHGDIELDLMVPRWGETPEKVLSMAQQIKVSSHFDDQIWLLEWNKWNDLNDSLMWTLFGKKKCYEALMKLRSYLVEREFMRSLSTRAYYLVRKVVLAWSERLGIGDDIFFWSREEILSKESLDEKILELRKKLYQGYRFFDAPNEFGGHVEQIKASNSGHLLSGVGCSSGEIIAPARVVLTLEDADQLNPEEILVTCFTDPGWTPVLARVKGVITEVGGVLSHAAVIGREYGIPAVLNVPKATTRIQTGQWIKLNGKTGVIEILEKSPYS
jgi:phosphohistidine swiveling domain-containing protein